MDLIDAVLQRRVVIVLAIAGAAIVLAGSLVPRRSARISPRLATFIVRFGYAVTWVSVGIFIVLGFRGG